MPRLYARVKNERWDTADWTSLPIDAQWLYDLLCSQRGISHAGVLTIPRREWVNLAGDKDAAARISAARRVLEDRRYIVVDDETDELLVRTMIKHDAADAVGGVFRAAMDAAIATRSPKLRAVLLEELHRLPLSVIEAKKPGHRQETPLAAWRRAVAALGGDPEKPRGARPPAEDSSGETTPEPTSEGAEYKADDPWSQPLAHVMSQSMSHGMDRRMPQGMSSHALGHGMPHGPGDGAGDGESPSVGEKLGGRARTHARGTSRGPRTDAAFAVQPCGRPHDPEPACRPCGDARSAELRDASVAQADHLAERRARRAAIDGCPDCDDNGLLETEHGLRQHHPIDPTEHTGAAS